MNSENFVLWMFALFVCYLVVKQFIWVAPDPKAEEDDAPSPRKRKRDSIDSMADDHAEEFKAPRSKTTTSAAQESSQLQGHAGDFAEEPDQPFDEIRSKVLPMRRTKSAVQDHHIDDHSDCQIPLGFNLADTRRDFD